MRTGFAELDAEGGILKDNVINTVLCETQYAKTLFISKIISCFLSDGGITYYIDLDTSFASSLIQNLNQMDQIDDIVIFTPDHRSLDDAIATVCSTTHPDPKLIVFDSAKTVYHLFAPEMRYADVNRRLGLYLALLRGFAAREHGTVISTSLQRGRPSSSHDMIRSYAGGRVLLKNSDVLILLSGGPDSLRLEVLKHQNQNLVGRVFSIHL